MKKILPVCMVLVLLLSACGRGDQTSDEALATNAPSAMEAPAQGAESPGAWTNFTFFPETPGPDGSYTFQARQEGGGNILYADYATGQLVYLCNRPECVHADDSCTSFRASNGVGLSVYRDRLYVFDISGAEGVAPNLSVCDKTGENVKTLFQLESGSMMIDLFAADGDAFYTLENVPDGTMGGITNRLVRISLGDGAKTNVGEKDYPNAEMLGGAGNEVVLRTFTIQEGGGNVTDLTIIGVDKTTGAEREIYGVGAGMIIGSKDGFAYVLRMEDGAVDAVDLISGEAQTIPFDKTAIKLDDTPLDVTGMAPEDAERISTVPVRRYDTRGIFDGKLFLDCTERQADDGNAQRALYAIDLATGEVTRITLSISHVKPGNPIDVRGEVGDDFYVMRDYIEAFYTAVGPDGKPYEHLYTANQYALIAKEDFYASKPNYRDFAPV